MYVFFNTLVPCAEGTHTAAVYDPYYLKITVAQALCNFTSRHDFAKTDMAVPRYLH